MLRTEPLPVPATDRGGVIIKKATATMGGAVLLLAIGSVATALGASTSLTKAQYLAKLRAANAASAKVDNAAGAAVGSKTASPQTVKSLMIAMGREHLAIGREFAGLTPPEAAAKANRDFAAAEKLFGKQNEQIAAVLPTSSRSAMLKYLQTLKPPSGGKLLDHAISELHAAGFKI
jgi:hypothetical protein